MVECTEGLFTEQVACYYADGYIKAHGWTRNTGDTVSYKYTPPAPWEYDPEFSDEWGTTLGGHGGCSYCIMTLVHLRKKVDNAIWTCNEPKSGWETNQYGETRQSSRCNPDTDNVIFDIISDIIPEGITKNLTYITLIVVIIAIITVYFITRR